MPPRAKAAAIGALALQWPDDCAAAMAEMSLGERAAVLAALPPKEQAAVLAALSAETRDDALAAMPPRAKAAAIGVQLEHWHCSRLMVVQQQWQRCH